MDILDITIMKSPKRTRTKLILQAPLALLALGECHLDFACPYYFPKMHISIFSDMVEDYIEIFKITSQCLKIILNHA